MSFRYLLALCIAFWSLSKSAQDLVLWTMQKDEDEDEDSTRAEARKQAWMINGSLSQKAVVLNYCLTFLSIKRPHLPVKLTQATGSVAEHLPK